MADNQSPERSVTLIVPTIHHRSVLFDRLLRYLADSQLECPIIVSDHSPRERSGVIADIVRRHPGREISVLLHPPDMHFLRRLVACAMEAKTPLVHLHADDDFVVRPTLDVLIDQMRQRPDVAAVMGLNVHVTLETGELTMLPKVSIDRAQPFERLIAQLESFSSVLYALRRRQEFIDSVTFAVNHCPDVQFWQYLESCLAALAGPIILLENLHYVRDVHPAKWSVSLVRERSPEHFPYLILSSDFGPRVTAFRSALVEACRAEGIAANREALDAAVIHLLNRGFTAMGLPEKLVPEGEAPDNPMVRLSESFSNLADPITVELNRIFRVAGT